MSLTTGTFHDNSTKSNNAFSYERQYIWDVYGMVLNAENTLDQINKPIKDQSVVKSYCAQSRCNM